MELNDSSVHLLRVHYSGQRNRKSWIFHNGGPGCDRHCRTMALYACARSTALVIASAVPFLTGSTGWLQAMAWSMIIVQACDAVIGGTIKDRMKTYGPAGTALLNLAALFWLIEAVR
jgi:hypothetical protein